jgi:tetratricopeptide (TPR) repeat protein
LADRVVEVIADQGKSRHRYGSGLIVHGSTVLTAAHVVAGAQAVRVRDPAKRLYPASVDPRFVGHASGPGPDLPPDLALVEIQDDTVDLPPIGLARVDRDASKADPVERCHAIGYPWFAETPSPDAVRETVDAIGMIPVLSNLAGGLLSVEVSQKPQERELPPQRVSLGKSEWSGMSGAPVLADGLLLGVVTVHAPRAGPSSITAVPVTALEPDPGHPGWGPGVEDPAAWWSRLGVRGVDDLTLLPLAQAKPAYEEVWPLSTAPPPPEAFVGREGLILKARERLLAGHDLSLFGGVAGVGKTTLAIALAHDHELREHFSDGVLWSSVGKDGTPRAKLGDWALELGLSRERVQSFGDLSELARAVAAGIGERKVLLIADDVWDSEQAVAFKVGGPACSHVITTRKRSVAVDFTDDGDYLAVGELADEDALALLTDMVPELEDNREFLDRCVAAAEGLPLAVRLIGKRLQLARGSQQRLGRAITEIESVAERLRLSQPRASWEASNLPEGVPVSLFAMIELSEQALDEAARSALASLSVFPPKTNSFSREAALAVSALGEQSVEALWDIGLLDDAVIIGSGVEDERYTMHQAIADYASLARGDPDAYGRMAAYLIHFLGLAGTDDRAFDAIDRERDNIFAALRWCVESETSETGLELVGALWNYWYHRSHFQEGRSWAEEVLALPGSTSSALAPLRGTALNVAGNCAYNQADVDSARAFHVQATLLRWDLGLDHDLAGSLNNLGLVAKLGGDYRRAERLFGRALVINERVAGDEDREEWIRERAREWRGINLNNMGVCAYEQGEYKRAVERQEESLEVFTELGKDWWRGMALYDLGNARRRLGDPGADEAYRESLRLWTRLQNRRGVAQCLVGLGELARGAGADEDAAERLQAALVLYADVSDDRGFAVALERLAEIDAKREGEARFRAAVWVAASDAIRTRLGFSVPVIVEDERKQRVAALREALGEERYEQALEAGKSLTRDDLLAQAQGERPVEWRAVADQLIASPSMA